MKVSVTTTNLEGTPEEFAAMDAAAIDRILGRSGSTAEAPVMPEGNENDDAGWGLDRDLAAFVRSRSQGGNTELFERYLAEVLSWGGTRSQVGRSKNTPDGKAHSVMIRAVPSHGFGAAAYVSPLRSRVIFRLQPEAADGFEHARVHGTNGEYRVAVPLVDEASLEDAYALLKLALDRIRTGA